MEAFGWPGGGATWPGGRRVGALEIVVLGDGFDKCWARVLIQLPAVLHYDESDG